jgi:hypothetical protein
MTTQLNRAHIGASLDDFLKKEGIFEEVEASARRRVQAVRDARKNFQIQRIITLRLIKTGKSQRARFHHNVLVKIH